MRKVPKKIPKDKFPVHRKRSIWFNRDKPKGWYKDITTPTSGYPIQWITAPYSYWSDINSMAFMPRMVSTFGALKLAINRMKLERMDLV